MPAYSSFDPAPWAPLSAEVKSVVIGDGVLNVGARAFYNFKSLTALSIGSTVRDIEDYAFFGCSAMDTLTIPDCVDTISSWAFAYCRGLKSVFIGEGVQYIYASAFATCENMESLLIGSAVTEIGRSAFNNCSSLSNVSYTGTAAMWAKINIADNNEPIENAEINFVTPKPPTPKAPAPTLKAANVTSTGKIKLTWNKVDSAAKYEVYRATSKTGTYSKLSTVTGTSLTNSKADVGKTYYYKVRALTADGSPGEYSAVVSCCCDCARPVITLSNVAKTGKIKISWAKVDGAEKYEVYRATSKTGTYSKLSTVTGTSLTNNKADAGKTYYYKVKAKAKTSSGDSAFSEIKSIVCDLAAPVVKIALSSGHPKLSWAKIDGATKYEIYRANSKTGTYTKLTSTAKTSLVNTSAKAGKTYYYKVKAIAKSSAANSAYSSAVSIKAK